MTLKLLGDLTLIATILFAAFIAFVRFAQVEAPEELAWLLDLSDWLAREFGPSWWALALGLGALLGWWIGGLGKGLTSKTEKHWDRR